MSIQYRGYTIEPTTSGAPYGGYDFFPTSEGRDEDYDWSGDGWKNCGNVRFASSLNEAKDEIFEMIMMSKPQHEVVLNGESHFFPWIEDAMRFAVNQNGELIFKD